jgi:hypothetical protein
MTMNSTNPTAREIILLPYVEKFSTQALEALLHGHAATIYGEEGCGVTTICRNIRDLWSKRDNRRVMYFTVCREPDYLKLLQHLASQVLGNEMPGDWRLHCASHLTHLMTAKIRASNVGLIVIDRADLAPGDFIDAIMTMASNCADVGAAVGVLMGVRQSGGQISLFKDISSTCVSFVGRIRPLDVGAVTVVIAEMAPAMRPLLNMVTGEDLVGIEAATRLAKISEGNFRRLAQFACHLADLREPISITAVSIEDLWKRSFFLESNRAA